MKLTKSQLKEIIREEIQKLNENLSAKQQVDTVSDKLFKSVKRYTGNKFSVVFEKDKTSIYIYYKPKIKKVVDPVSVDGAIIIDATKDDYVYVYGDDGYDMYIGKKIFYVHDESKINNHIKKLVNKMWR
jgi:hypothetical protein